MLAVTTFVVALFFGVYLAIYWIISREVINTTLRRLLFILLIAIDIAMIVCGFFILANVPGGLQVVDWVIAVFLVLGLLAVGVGVGIFISVIDELITIRKIQKAGERDH